MFDNCQNCLFYDKERDDLYREHDDFEIENDPNPNKHFCIRFKAGIAKDIWHNKEKCPHYVKDIER